MMECRAYLEAKRWPDGPVCPKCGAGDPYRIERKSRSKNVVTHLYKCREKECRKQFTATVGTIFEDSKIPLSKWFAAIYLMCSSKKGMSAHQLHRQLGITYKSAWFMCHRVREAMREKGFLPLAGVVERPMEPILALGRGVGIAYGVSAPRTRSIWGCARRSAARDHIRAKRWCLGCWSGMGASRL